MRTHLQIILVGICLVAITAAFPGSSFAKAIWGQNVGPVSATVIQSDSGSRIAVRSGPSSGSRVMGYLTPGARVQGFSRFGNGYMNLKQPYRGGWVQVGSLTPLSSTAQVISVDQPDGCLRIRSGPGMSYEIVGCVPNGTQLQLTGTWNSENWAEVEQPVRGWVYARQIRTAIDPSYPGAAPVAYAETSVYSPTIYEEEPVVVYGSRYPRTYFYGSSYWPFHSKSFKRHHFHSNFNSGVRVTRGGGVSVRAGGVGVRVGNGGVSVRVGRGRR